jgi:hypothetical protein
LHGVVRHARHGRHSAVTSTRRRLGGTAVGVGGVAFALIQILQQTVGAFDPRPVVSLLVAVTIGLAGLVLQRARHRAARSGVLRARLRVWPLPRIGDVDPLALGVFPPADAVRGSSLGPYVARDADDAVRSALDEGGLVVLVGPDRAGKSRTAYEVARDSYSDHVAVVPVGGAALAALLDDASFTPATDALWWLDDLERFAEHLDSPELALLLDGRIVVMTVRPQAWEELLRASGDAGERGRRLAAVARVIVIPAAASVEEAERARELYPEPLNLTGGLGAALGAMPAPSKPRALTPASPIGEHERHLAGDRSFVLGMGATAASVIALALVLNAGGWAKRTPPPVSNQLDTIRQRAEREGSVTVFSGVEDLHGVRSHVFVLAPKTGSRELRIYDEDGGWLRLRLKFRPQTRSNGESGRGVGVCYCSEPPEVLQRGDWDYNLRRPLALDIDKDGDSELLATYELVLGISPIVIPLVVAWDDHEQRYAISPVLEENKVIPGQLGPYFSGDYTLADARAYPRPYPRLRAGAASQIRPSNIRIFDNQSLIVARAIDLSGPERLAIGVYDLTLDDGRVSARVCGDQHIVPTGRRSAKRVLRDVATKFAREVADSPGLVCTPQSAINTRQAVG